MNANRQTTVLQGNSKERNMKITTAKLIRWAGLSAMAAGIIFIIIQTIHPFDVLSSVTTGRWVITHALGVAMCLLGLLGVTGLYARQVKAAGWLGLAGYLLLTVFYALTLAFQFIAAVIVPLVATAARTVVEGWLAVPSGQASASNLGGLPGI